MTRKIAYYALAVVLLMGSMAGVALADNEETNWMYVPADSSVSSEPGVALEQAYEGEIREPVETGALPNWPESSSSLSCCSDSGDPTYWHGGP